MPEHVENPTLRPILGEQPAEPPATPGTVTVLLTIPWEMTSDGPHEIDAAERTVMRLVRKTPLFDLLRDNAFDVDNVTTTATFEADQDPGDKR